MQPGKETHLTIYKAQLSQYSIKKEVIGKMFKSKESFKVKVLADFSKPKFKLGNIFGNCH